MYLSHFHLGNRQQVQREEKRRLLREGEEKRSFSPHHELIGGKEKEQDEKTEHRPGPTSPKRKSDRLDGVNSRSDITSPKGVLPNESNLGNGLSPFIPPEKIDLI